MNKPTLFIIFIVQCIFSGVCSGQTASQLEEKYGKPTSSYAVSEHIWMSPEFADDGQMCRARLYPRHISDDTNYLGYGLPQWELKDVLNRLAPVQTRGAKSEYSGLSSITGQSANTVIIYENVSFTFSTALNFGPTGRGPKPSSEAKKSGDEAASDDFFINSLVIDAEIVVVNWNKRKCGNK